MARLTARVIVTPKPVVNDPQGITVKGGLHRLGFPALGHWQRAGATHVSVNTMKAGLETMDDHLRALAEVADVAKALA